MMTGGERVFNRPWEAQSFAIAVALHDRGVFTWPEWTEAIAAVIAEARDRGDPDLGDDYYVHWTTALERIVAGQSLLSFEQLAERRAAWADAGAPPPPRRARAV
jgi:nitrile hydratase accessory protein